MASGSGIGNGTVNSTGSQSQRKRRSRISVGGLFQPAGRKAGGSVSGISPSVANMQGSGSSHGNVGTSGPVDSHTHGRNKLRKPRSIPDLASTSHDQQFGTNGVGAGSTAFAASSASASASAGPASRSSYGHGPNGRAHSHSVTGADMSRLRGLPASAFGDLSGVSSPRDTSFGSNTGHVRKRSGDVFSSAMGWGSKDAAASSASLAVLPGTASARNVSYERCARHGKANIRHPFGRGVITFDSPARGSAVWLPAVSSDSNSASETGITADNGGDLGQGGQTVWGRRIGGREIREVQSFESGLTARAVSVRRVKRVESRESGSVISSASGEGSSGAGTNGDGKGKKAKMLRHDSMDSLASAASLSGSQTGIGEGDESEMPTSPSSGHAASGSSFSPLSPSNSTTQQLKCPLRAVPSPESSLHTRYATSVFDVIQNYRGLPMLDLLDDEHSNVARQPTIKMSLSALDGAVPRDDPRFVIWGEVKVGVDDGEDEEGDAVHRRERVSSAADSDRDKDGISASSRRSSRAAYANASRTKRASHGKVGISSSGPSPPELRIEGIAHDRDAPRDGYSGGSASPSISPSLALSQDDSEGRTGSTLRVMMAATIERWIAQLTSQLDYDELLIFFLTYRTYISASDLCHLLICRFHWALEEPLTGAEGGAVGGTVAHEVMVKQIVRLRTFVAIRYWLLTFFRVDFLPNRELCLLFANWLNTLWRDPILDRYRDAKVRNLGFTGSPV